MRKPIALALVAFVAFTTSAGLLDALKNRENDSKGDFAAGTTAEDVKVFVGGAEAAGCGGAGEGGRCGCRAEAGGRTGILQGLGERRAD